ncbi:MAG TPA: hypothetical protein VMU84_16270 [Thermoanaerobaculia bacterium]|nr:hypothetical protein [Thermoanaerobaculia bacterium]
MIKRTNMMLAAIALIAGTAHADGMADLRAALAKFPARESLRATIAIESENRGDDDEPAKLGRGSLDVEHGADGVRMIYAPEVIARAQQERRANEIDPEKPEPTVSALRELDAIALIEALDVASVIARNLDSAKLEKDVRLPNGGKPIRQLTFSVKPRLSKSDAKRIKSATGTLIINLGTDGIPISAEMSQALKAKFLLMSFEMKGQESWTFGRAGDHLVAARHHKQQSGSGLGQSFSSSSTTTVVVR